ncbi:MAG: zinc-ribbon domain-containing protein [Lachnospiraceae bacterium]|nr:zinc-ribbon domain-containing protein [Lachnospiraceae bacterium]
MGFCSRCGKEYGEGAMFCGGCGARIGGDVLPSAQDASGVQDGAAGQVGSGGEYRGQNNVEVQNGGQQGYAGQTVFGIQLPPSVAETLAKIDKFGPLIGIGLLLLAIVMLKVRIPLFQIMIGLPIVAASAFCLIRKYKWKGFPIASLILGALILLSGIGDAKSFGLLDLPSRSVDRTASEDRRDEESDEPEQKEALTKDENEATNEASPEAAKEAEASAVNEAEATEAAATNEGDANDPSAAQTADPAAAGESADETSFLSDSGFVDPDLKAFLDSYEDFVDEYVDFMRKYNADPSNMMMMLGEYSEIMEKYMEFADKLDKYDSDDMSMADAAYYLEVTTRCSKKMLEIY